LVELEPLALDAPEHHRAQSPIAHGQRLDPLRGGATIPERVHAGDLLRGIGYVAACEWQRRRTWRRAVGERATGERGALLHEVAPRGRGVLHSAANSLHTAWFHLSA